MFIREVTHYTQPDLFSFFLMLLFVNATGLENRVSITSPGPAYFLIRGRRPWNGASTRSSCGMASPPTPGCFVVSSSSFVAMIPSIMATMTIRFPRTAAALSPRAPGDDGSASSQSGHAVSKKQLICLLRLLCW